MSIFFTTILVGLAAFVINATMTVLLVFTKVLDPLKIDPSPYRRRDIAKRLPLILRTFVSTTLAAAIGFTVLARFFITDRLPSLGTVVGNVAFIFVFHDTWIYFLHRYLHHNRTLYRKVHSVHHRARRPIPLDFLHLHWAEGALGAVGMIAAIAVLSPINIYCLWAYIFAIHVHEGHIHWGLRSALPFAWPGFTTIAHHDLHHAHPYLNANFAPIGSVLDKLFKTESVPARALLRGRSTPRLVPPMITRDEMSNWLGDTWKPKSIHAPKSWQALMQVLRCAIADGEKVGIVGRGYSWSPGYETRGYQISTANLNHIGRFDAETRTIEVGAGTTVRALNRHLKRAGIGYALVSVATLDDTSFGGLVSNGCHGSDGRYQPIADHITSFTILVRVGDTIERIAVSAASDPERWEYMRMGFGLCGVIDSITLELEPLYNVEVLDEKRALTLFDVAHPDRIRELVEADGQVLITHLPFSGGVSVKTMRRTTGAASGYHLGDRIPWIVAPYVNRLFGSTVRRFPAMTPSVNRAMYRMVPEERSRRTLTDAVHCNDRQGEYRCILSAFAIKADADFSSVVCAWRIVDEVIREHAALGKYPINICINCRFVAGTPTRLSPVHGTRNERFGVFDLVSYVDTAGYEDAIRVIVARWRAAGLGPKPFWAKLGVPILGSAVIRDVYGDALDGFLAFRERIDPTRMFLNDYYQNLFAL